MKIITNDTEFDLLDGETILEGLERTGHHVEYQCRSGYCGSCRTQLKEGRVEYISEPMAFLNKNEIVPCCALPLEPIRIDASLIKNEKDLKPSRHSRYDALISI